MLLNWVTIFHELTALERGRDRDPLADPLERPEWRGLTRIFGDAGPPAATPSSPRRRGERRR